MKALYNLFNKRGQLIALGIGLVCIIIIFSSIFAGLSSGGFDTSTDLNQVMKNGGGDGFNFFNSAYLLPVFLTILAITVILVFGLKGLVSNPRGSLTFLIAVGVLLALFFLFTSISGSETTGKIADLIGKNNIGESTSKMISGGIKSVVLLSVVACIAIVVLEIYNFFK